MREPHSIFPKFRNFNFLKDIFLESFSYSWNFYIHNQQSMFFDDFNLKRLKYNRTSKNS